MDANNNKAWLERAALSAVPDPASFPLGSEESRAAARAVLNAKAAVSEDESLTITVSRLDGHAAIEPDRCAAIVREAGYLRGPCAVVRLDRLPPRLNSAQAEQWLREHGAEICSPPAA